MELILIGDNTPRFNDGSIDITTAQIVRTYQFHPDIEGYQGKISEGDVNQIPPISFEGGSLRAYVPGPINLPLASQSNLDFAASRISISTSPVPATGAVTGFSFWTGDLVADPATLIVEASTGAETAGVGAPWNRHNATVVVPENARFIGVGASFHDMAVDSNSQFMNKVQVEPAPIGQAVPTPYSKAREIQVVVRPDLVNYSENPNFWTNTTDWTGLTRVAYTPSKSGYAGQVVRAADTAAEVTHVLSSPPTGKTIRTRVMAVASEPVSVMRVVSGATQVHPGLAVEDATVRVGTTPVPVTLDFIPTEDVVSLHYHIQPTSAAVTVTFFEMTTAADAPYFDGSSSGDHMWEEGGASGNARSYYYKNRLERYAALRRVLTENVPLGIGTAEPQFAVHSN